MQLAMVATVNWLKCNQSFFVSWVWFFPISALLFISLYILSMLSITPTINFFSFKYFHSFFLFTLSNVAFRSTRYTNGLPFFIIYCLFCCDLQYIQGEAHKVLQSDSTQSIHHIQKCFRQKFQCSRRPSYWTALFFNQWRR